MSKTRAEETAAEESIETQATPTEPVESTLEEAIVTEASARVHWLTVVLVLIALGATAGLGWLGWVEITALRAQHAQMTDRLDQVESMLKSMQTERGQLRGLETNVAQLNQQLESARRETQSVIERVESIVDQSAKASVDTRSQTLLAEAEYLLKLADQRLWVERNPDTARPLMQSAQAVLGEVQDNRLLPVRERLAADLQALASIETVDVMGMQAEVLALDGVLDRLQLPTRRLSDAPVVGADSQPSIGEWLGPLAEFIRIREVEALIAPLVTAADAGRAREILRLNLEQIKLALLREDQALFDAAVAQALRLTRHYFNVSEGPGLGVIDTLQGLEGRAIVRTLPDASSGLRALRLFRDARLTDVTVRPEATP